MKAGCSARKRGMGGRGVALSCVLPRAAGGGIQERKQKLPSQSPRDSPIRGRRAALSCFQHSQAGPSCETYARWGTQILPSIGHVTALLERSN